MENQQPIRVTINFNPTWKFKLGCEKEAYEVNYDDSNWETVILPHTPKIEAMDVCKHYQGECWYRKRFTVNKDYQGKKVFVEFEAAMHLAKVWVNGQLMMVHEGGYLPFTIDMTDYINFNEENIIAVWLDNSDNGDIPPGRPLERLDFSYFGGLYRNVHLYVTNKLYITDAVYADKVASGGIFVTYSNVSKKSTDVKVAVHVKNEYDCSQQVKLMTKVKDHIGNVLYCKESEYEEVFSENEATLLNDIRVENPRLWHPDSPYLYTLDTTLLCEDKVVDYKTTKIGIRHLALKKPEGLLINGNPIKIRGANRHQQYPYIGNAASDQAQYRDAKKLKEAGFNFIRVGHYPQSNAFLDACDELGLMVVEPTPGWQWCKEGRFKELVIQNIKDMVRRDRNHPCIIMWEVSLNETGTYWQGATDEFFRQCHVTAHEEYPGDQLLTSGDTAGREDPVFVGFDVPYNGWDEETKSRPLEIPGKMGIDREYGDFEFGGAYSTTRCLRGQGEEALHLQAWNFQWSHNRNRRNDWALGDSIWVGNDYTRGCGVNDPDPMCNCGIMDTFRIPKVAYYFYQSQRNPQVIHEDVDSGPMVYIANYWTPESSSDKIVVYSNCEEVKLFINDRLIETRNADNGPDLEYEAKNIEATVDYWLKGKDIPKKEDGEEIDPLATLTMTNLFDGGNCRHIDHAPFTFYDVPYLGGQLKAVGFIDGKEVAVDVRNAPKKVTQIRLDFDISGKDLVADGSDFIFVYAKVTDDDGTLIYDNDHDITFTVDGPGELIGVNPINTEAGIATILLKSTVIAGYITIKATSKELKEAVREVRSI